MLGILRPFIAEGDPLILVFSTPSIEIAKPYVLTETELKRLALEKAEDCFERELFSGASMRFLLKVSPTWLFI